MTGQRADRIAGWLLLFAAAAAAVEARTFTVNFLADPLGPKALPLFAAALLAVGAILVLRRPESDPVWPEMSGAIRLGAACASFAVYGAMLSPVGFLLATAVEVAILARLFGGRPGPSLATGVVVAGALYALFVFALGLSLPTGTVLAGLPG